MSLFGFGPSCDIEFELDKSGGGGGGEKGATKEPRKSVEVLEDGKKVKQLIYYDGEDVTGTVHIRLKKPGTKIDHQGIRLEFVGQIELYYDRSNHHVFSSLSKLLAYPGEITENMSVDFNFPAVDKPHESYNGVNVKLRYFLRLTIIKRFSNITKEEDIFVHTLSAYPELNSSIKMEVGIEDCLHIEFEYNKSKYHLRDVIIGKIYFLLVRIKVKYMELAIIKREIIGDNAQNETETVAKYEIMDGAPVKGESIPIRLFLSAYNLTPTMRDIQKKFSCKYYLNLVLVDEEERRYFKQQEIILWRKADKYKSKQERSDQMQVYEPSQPMHTGDGNQSSGRYTSNRSGGGGGGKVGANNNGGGGTGGGSSANRVRHDENGDLLDDDDDDEDTNNNGGGSGGDESDDEAGLVSNTVSKSKPVNNNNNNSNATPKKQQDQFSD